MEKGGKLSVKGCHTAKDEVYSLAEKARRSQKKNNEREKHTEYIEVPILKGILKVEKPKYLKNKDHYQSIATGKIKEII